MPRRARLRLAAFVAILALFPVVSLVSASPSVERLSGASPVASCTAGRLPDKGAVFTDAESEPYIAVNPRGEGTLRDNLIAVWQQDRWSTGSARALVAAYSVDAGRTWTRVPLPFSRCVDPQLEETRVSDPWVSIGPDGTAYASGVNSGPRLNGIVTATSTDGGRTWSEPRQVIEESNRAGFNDKPAITADPSSPGVAYLVWDRGLTGKNPPQPLWFARTVDGGRTWSPPRQLTYQSAPNTGTLGNQLLVDSRRHLLYIIFERFIQPPRFRMLCSLHTGHRRCRRITNHVKPGTVNNVIAFMRSQDGGRSWTRQKNLTLDLSIGVKAGGKDLRTGANLPAPALDPRTGTVYVTWEDARFSDGRYEEIALTSSTDGGRDWRAPIRVNLRTGTPAFEPAIAVNRHGTVGITYYVLGRAGVGPHSVPTNYVFTESRDDGRHFTEPVHLYGPFNMLTAPNSDGLFLGDYEGLVAEGARFRSVFVATNSRSLHNRTDVFTAKLR